MVIHVRHNGRSFDFAAHQVDVGDRSTDQQVRAAVATKMSEPRSSFDNYVVDRNAKTGDLTVRPQAVFG